MVVVDMTGAFANVRRRPRSAGSTAAARPRKEQLAVHGSGASAAASSENGTKQPSSSSSSRSEAEHVVQAEKHGLHQVEEPVAKNGGGGDLRRDVPDTSPPAPSSRNENGFAAPPASRKDPVVASSSSSAAARVKDAEELRRRKGKMRAPDQTLPEPNPSRNAAAAPAPPERRIKILGDAIRCYGSDAGAAAAVAPSIKPASRATQSASISSKKRKDSDCGAPFWFGMGGEGQSTSSAGSDMDLSLERIPVASACLRQTLYELGVDPVRVYGKMMSRSDRTSQQARLLMSCKSWRGGDGEFPLDAFMTEEEKGAAHGAGLGVLAYDRAGELYGAMKCRYLPSNLGYRIIGNWGEFLRRNGLVERSGGGSGKCTDVLIDLWLFRSPTDGKLGIVFMHYRRGDAAHADAAFAEPVVKKMRKNNRRRNPAAEADSATEDDGMEIEDEDDVIVVEDGVAMQDVAAGGNDVVMEDAAYDAIGGGGGGEASTLPSSDAIGVTLVLEVTVPQEEATVPLASTEADNVKADKKGACGPGKLAAPSPPDAGGATEEDEAGAAQGQPPTPSPFNANGAKVVEVHAPPPSDETAEEQGTAAQPVSSLSGYKQDVIEAAKTLMLISQGFW